MGFLGYNRGSDCSFSVGDGDPLGRKREQYAVRVTGALSLFCVYGRGSKERVSLEQGGVLQKISSCMAVQGDIFFCPLFMGMGYNTGNEFFKEAP